MTTPSVYLKSFRKEIRSGMPLNGALTGAIASAKDARTVNQLYNCVVNETCNDMIPLNKPGETARSLDEIAQSHANFVFSGALSYMRDAKHTRVHNLWRGVLPQLYDEQGAPKVPMYCFLDGSRELPEMERKEDENPSRYVRK